MLTDRSAFYGQDLLVWNGKAWDPSTFERVKEMLKCLAFFLQTDLSLTEKNPFFSNVTVTSGNIRNLRLFVAEMLELQI